MSNLPMLNNENFEVTTIDSRKVAEMMEIEHKNLLRNIRQHLEYLKIGELKIEPTEYFKESTYFDDFNRKQNNYQVTKKGCELLAHKLTGMKGTLFSARYIEVFHKMESMIKNPTQSYMIQDPIERAKAWIKEQEEKQALEHQVKALEPARIFTQAVTGTEDSILIRELATILKQNGVDIGEKRLYKWLRENGYVIKREGIDKNLPTQKSLDLGILEVRESVRQIPNQDPKLQKTTRVTGKGQQYFINKFLKQKY